MSSAALAAMEGSDYVDAGRAFVYLSRKLDNAGATLAAWHDRAWKEMMAKAPKDEIGRRVAEVADVLQLSEVLDRRPSQLSGGQRQRVAMGRAIIRHPQAFLMDEPLSNLDAKLRVEMRAEIARLQRELAVTTVYVTHDQTEAMTMGTRVAVMRDGHLLQVDTPQRLYDEPIDLFVATFMASAMNLFAATVEPADDGGASLALRLGSQRLALDPSVAAAHPGVADRVGDEIVLGIRPESFADVAVEPGAPADRVIEVTVDLVESLGGADRAPAGTHSTAADERPRRGGRSCAGRAAASPASAPAAGRWPARCEAGGRHRGRAPVRSGDRRVPAARADG